MISGARMDGHDIEVKTQPYSARMQARYLSKSHQHTVAPTLSTHPFRTAGARALEHRPSRALSLQYASATLRPLTWHARAIKARLLPCQPPRHQVAVCMQGKLDAPTLMGGRTAQRHANRKPLGTTLPCQIKSKEVGPLLGGHCRAVARSRGRAGVDNPREVLRAQRTAQATGSATAVTDRRAACLLACGGAWKHARRLPLALWLCACA